MKATRCGTKPKWIRDDPSADNGRPLQATPVGYPMVTCATSRVIKRGLCEICSRRTRRPPVVPARFPSYFVTVAVWKTLARTLVISVLSVWMSNGGLGPFPDQIGALLGRLPPRPIE